MKFVFVNPNNFTNHEVVGFVNNYPEEFKQWFEVDYDLQFEKSFLSIIERFFEVIGWGQVNLKKRKKLDI